MRKLLPSKPDQIAVVVVPSVASFAPVASWPATERVTAVLQVVPSVVVEL